MVDLDNVEEFENNTFSLTAGLHAMVSMQKQNHPISRGSEATVSNNSFKVILFYWPTNDAFSDVNRSNISCLYLRILHEISDNVCILVNKSEIDTFYFEDDVKDFIVSSVITPVVETSNKNTVTIDKDAEAIVSHISTDYQQFEEKNRQKQVKTSVKAFRNALIVGGTDTCAIGFKYLCNNLIELKKKEKIFDSGGQFGKTQMKKKMIEYIREKSELYQISYNRSKFDGFNSLEIIVKALNKDIWQQYKKEKSKIETQYQTFLQEELNHLTQERYKTNMTEVDLNFYNFFKYKLSSISNIEENIWLKMEQTCQNIDNSVSKLDGDCLSAASTIKKITELSHQAAPELVGISEFKNMRKEFSQIVMIDFNNNNGNKSDDQVFLREFLPLFEKYKEMYKSLQQSVQLDVNVIRQELIELKHYAKCKSLSDIDSKYHEVFCQFVASNSGVGKSKMRIEGIGCVEKQWDNAFEDYRITFEIEQEMKNIEKITFMQCGQLHNLSNSKEIKRTPMTSMNFLIKENENMLYCYLLTNDTLLLVVRSRNNGNDNCNHKRKHTYSKYDKEEKSESKEQFRTKVFVSSQKVLSHDTVPIKSFNKDVDLVSFGEKNAILVLYSKQENCVTLYKCVKHFSRLHQINSILLNEYEWVKDKQFYICQMIVNDEKNDIVLIDNSGILRIYCLNRQNWYNFEEKVDLQLKREYKKYLVTPDGEFLLCFDSKSNDQIVMSTIYLAKFEYIGILVLPKWFTSNLIKYLAVKRSRGSDGVGMVTSLVAIDNNHGPGCDTMKMIVQDLKIVVSRRASVALKGIRDIKMQQSKEKRKQCKLNYFEHMLDKFGSRPEFFDVENGKLRFNTTWMLNLDKNSDGNCNVKELTIKCGGICERACDLVQRACHKDFTKLSWQSTVVIAEPSMTKSDYNICNSPFGSGSVSDLGLFIEKLIIQLPIQIARGFNNELCLMYNGEDRQKMYYNCTNAYDWSKNIRFGAYDAVIGRWAKGKPICVISSMGKQSTGKSFKLNHLFGTKFDVSGMRCTDGVWMTVRIINGTLFIVLDFEGLGSFERSYQEDALLSVLNAAISQCTIFKCENRFDADVKRMFERFENSVNYLSGDDDRLFRGNLLIVVRDIADSDRTQVIKEFNTKIEQCIHVHSTSRSNYNENAIHSSILKMYNQIIVQPYPSFLSDLFFHRLKLFREHCIKNISNSNHTDGGKIFLEFFKLVLAKLAMMDDDPLVPAAKMRIDELNEYLLNGINYGALQIEKESLNISSFAIANVDDSVLKCHCVVACDENLQDFETKETIDCDGKFVVAQWLAKYSGGNKKDCDVNIKNNRKDNDNYNNVKIVNEMSSDVGDERCEGAAYNAFYDILKDDKTLQQEFINCLNSIEDCGLILNDKNTTKYLFLRFEESIQSLQRTHDNFEQGLVAFEAFLEMIYLRRRQRIVIWLNKNTCKFDKKAERNTLIIPFVKHASNLLKRRLKPKLVLCKSRCGNNGCQYFCLLPQLHEKSILYVDQLNNQERLPNNHDCFSDHKCQEECHYCVLEQIANDQDKVAGNGGTIMGPCDVDLNSPVNELVTNKCRLGAGHSGVHICHEKEHVCGKKCPLNKHRGCNLKCHKQIKHDGECKCDSNQHSCDHACDAVGCKELCNIGYDKDHKRHECQRAQGCLEECQVTPQCKNKCHCDDHFHSDGIQAQTAKFSFHCCNASHKCPEKCEAGICGHTVRKQQKLKEKFVNNRSEFEYVITKEQCVNIAPCKIAIPKFQLVHEESHCCHKSTGEHFCNRSCLNCGYFCKNRMNHKGKCQTTHGNMINTVFLSQNKNIDIPYMNSNNQNYKMEMRMYQRNDSGKAETCGNWCRTMGRGHIHTIPCSCLENERKVDVEDDNKDESSINVKRLNVADTSTSKNCKRHVEKDENGLCKYCPSKDEVHDTIDYKCLHQVDECTHSYYWDSMGFEDPTKGMFGINRKEFDSCKHYCSHPSHNNHNDINGDYAENNFGDNIGGKASYCLLPLSHSWDINGNENGNDNNKYNKYKYNLFNRTMVDGHLFGCKHKSGHIIFMIDRSTSMRNNDVQPTLSWITEKKLRMPKIQLYPLNDTYNLNNRLGCVYEAIYQFMRSRMIKTAKDVLSIILFTTEVTHVCTKLNIQDPKYFIQQYCLKYGANGATDFNAALEAMPKIKDNESTIILFLTDGIHSNEAGADGKRPSDRVKELTKDKYCKFFPIMFRNDKKCETLTKMAVEAGTQVKHANQAVELANYFFDVVAKANQDISLLAIKEQIQRNQQFNSDSSSEDDEPAITHVTETQCV